MAAICIIPARGGSLRIPNKNRKLFHGRPIIEYSIKVAKDAQIFRSIYVSTDDLDIAVIAKRNGCLVLKREKRYALDDVGTQDVIRHEMMRVKPLPGWVCVLYATAPLLEADTLQRAYYMLRADPIVPYVVPVGNWLRDPGQFYFGRTDSFLDNMPLNCDGTKLIFIEPERDRDINTMYDWRRAEKMYAALRR